MAVQDGMGGTEVAPRAHALASLGFTVAAFCDNDDRAVDVPLAAAESAGVTAIRWEFGHSTETQVCSQLEEEGLNSFLELAVQRRDSASTVLDDLNFAAPDAALTSLAVGDWLVFHYIAYIRSWVARAAIKRGWFKDVAGGRDLC